MQASSNENWHFAIFKENGFSFLSMNGMKTSELIDKTE